MRLLSVHRNFKKVLSCLLNTLLADEVYSQELPLLAEVRGGYFFIWIP